MHLSTRTVWLVAAVLAMASPAAAQTDSQAYVGVSLVGDIARFSHAEVDFLDDGSGEAIGFGLRAGTAVGSIWGVELEFVRPGAIESSLPQILPASALDLLPGNIILPSFRYDLRSETRNTTLTPALWVRQELTARASLVYTGGVAFLRSEHDLTINIASQLPIIPGLPGSAIFPAPTTATVEYSVRPMVGVESRIRMTEHLQLVPGIRLYGLQNGWLFRPSAGLNWIF